jgi:putative phosphonate transport system ATP-binding protein
MNAVLAASGLTKIYGAGCARCLELTGPEFETSVCPACGSVVAIANVSLELRAAEILGILGESGSGKSTLLRLLHLDEKPDAGGLRFYLDGAAHQPLIWNRAEQRRFRDLHLSLVHQNPVHGLNFRFSAGGNVAERMFAAGKRSFASIRSEAAGKLRRMEFPVERMDETPARFSGGMQQRVQIAKALAVQPAIAFLDEVTSALDPSVQASILDLLLELQQKAGMSMIVVTHNISVIRLLL